MAVAETELHPQQSGPLRLFRAVPGGEPPTSVETTAALLVLGAVVFLIALRKGFRPVLAS